MPFTFANVNGRSALIRDDSFFDLEVISEGAVSSDPMVALIESNTLHELSANLENCSASGNVEDVVLGAPVPRPTNSFGIGLNYQTHVDEADMDTPDVPMVFAKLPSCITGPTSDIQMLSGECDYEGELVVVIGSGGKNIDEGRGWEHVIGLTVGQDFSDRAAQFMNTPAQFTLGKSIDSFGPTGPVLVSTDSFANPADLELRTWVNGELRQHDRTSSLIFSIPELIAFVSRYVTLSTGDLIFTGTPEGVGFRNGVFLTNGDVVRTSIEGIGTLENRCIRTPV